MNDRILVALDFPDAETALAMASRLRGAVGGFKVGKQLFTAEGPALVRALAAAGDRVFLDLKFHDIPNTVGGAIESAAALGVWMVNVHASGGRAMMTAAREAADRAAGQGAARPLVIAVTVLTSLDAEALGETGMPADPPGQVARLAALAHDAGLDGVVCSPREIEIARARGGKDFLIVTPGIRGTGDAKGDQQRTATPAGAIRAGADFLVIGRPITAARDPRAAAEAIGVEIASATSR
ncbi:MAG: orotidine-5'-phosphate decarboxylase [Acidobacteriota bacterium]|nr:orotidine-5'-phosphate decarboxylase [Acidobacteriota bacterium]